MSKLFRVEYHRLRADGNIESYHCVDHLLLEGGMESEALYELKKRNANNGYVILKITPD